MEDGVRTRRSLYPREANKPKTETCVICYDDNIGSNLMFCVDNCGHRFCLNCVKKHIEVKLLDGAKQPNCPQNRCKSKLSIDRCGKLLTTKLRYMWKQGIKEDSMPIRERIYCPYRRCSYLMSKTELYTWDTYGLRQCFKCGGSFCVHCKVPWHRSLSCTDYKKLCPRSRDDDAMLKSLAKSKGWRQCGKCQHMVERSSGCAHIKCRCGHVFCYKCGDEWDSVNHRRDCRYWFDHDFEELLRWLISRVILLMIFLGIVYLIITYK